MTKRSQFSIRALLAIIAIIGLALGAIVGEPSVASGVLQLFMRTMIPAIAVVGIIQSHGYRRAFCIGILIPSSLGFAVVGRLFVGNLFESFPYTEVLLNMCKFRTSATLIWSLALANGLGSVAFQWLIAETPTEAN